MRLGVGLGVNVLVGAGVGAWTPSDISTALWLDANDSSTITESAGAVSQWNDKSGLGANATQAIGSKQPLTGTRTLNGVNVIDFDGNTLDSSLRCSTVYMDGVENAMVFVVGQYDTRTNYEAMIYSSQMGIGVLIADWRYYWGGSQHITSGSPVDFVPHIFNTCLKDGTDASMFIDGTSIDDRVIASETVGDNLPYIGSRDDLYHFDGYIGEIVVVKFCTDSDRQKIEGYLAHKWGLEARLPVLHPYKNSPPEA